MEAAALLLLVAGVGGVDFGWQPMPDGSPRYEYLVQIEPEMLESLAEGRSIPIAGDAPDEVHPIARVRVTVGRGALPRQLLATHRKPVDAEAAPDSGVTLTQYTEAIGTPRYATTPPAFDAYTQAPPATGGGAGWNGGDAAATGGNATGGNWNAGAPLAEVADSTAGRLRDGFQQATEPLQEGINQFGDQIRSAAGDLGDRTNQMLDDLGLPPRRAGVPDAAGSGAAPLSAAPPQTAGGTWNAGAEDGVQGYPGNEWMRNNPAAAAAAPPSPGGPAGVPDSSFGSSWNTGEGDPSLPVPTLADSYRNAGPAAGTGAPSGTGGGLTAPPLATGAGGRGATVADPWDNAADPRFRTAQQGSGTGAAAGGGFGSGAAGGGFAGAPGGTAFPGFTNTSTGGANGSGPTLGDPSGAAGAGPPQVDAGMLALPGDRPLDGAADAASGPATGMLGGGFNGSGVGSLGGSVFAPVTAGPPNPAGTNAGSDMLSSQGWGSNQPPASSQAAADAATNNTATEQNQNRLLVLVAWVLLFASIAGNLYLFWSYLDVRTKYRALVRKTARAVGSRFSPA